MISSLLALVFIISIISNFASGDPSSSDSTCNVTPNVKLRNGVEMPQLALGTAPLVTGGEDVIPINPKFEGFLPELVYRSLTLALEAGIRHIDTALCYRSHLQVSRVLGDFFASGKLKRSDVFITSKVFHPYNSGFSTSDTVMLDLGTMTPEQVTDIVTKHFERSLTELGVGFVDLMLLHWPGEWYSKDSDGNAARRLAAWRVLEAMYEKGWARAIGVSNFSEHHLERLQKDGANVIPMVNQIEASVFVQYDSIIEYCKKHFIIPEAYSPLGRGVNHVTTNPTVLAIGEKHGKDSGQIALRYLIQRGFAVTFLSTSEKRLKSNQEIFDFELDTDDMDMLSGLNRPDGSWGLCTPSEIS
mmetsp:Transcript_47066/g.69724  ORF Transcript_47066/g.69724 Transcript_47066/m.69724 type:complete len:358 (+) Transcript_47066:72-1145(+)|eukprot:CAMPEP_0195529330 /NCGR_PEP_ID=MMETSP0794_2-20130614/31821_1 /TAXON_ID=515487 /ORGANISM="Stephanopyxis turris, Strain CCMP 815" /LENGTH=357 /DNA_ID=CAMNT_0040660619 /DNA_START=72 /DNA_END=1145 /DNA_ORIENTATION=-